MAKDEILSTIPVYGMCLGVIIKFLHDLHVLHG